MYAQNDQECFQFDNVLDEGVGMLDLTNFIYFQGKIVNGHIHGKNFLTLQGSENIIAICDYKNGNVINRLLEIQFRRGEVFMEIYRRAPLFHHY